MQSVDGKCMCVCLYNKRKQRQELMRDVALFYKEQNSQARVLI
jgi:hypothetical protein